MIKPIAVHGPSFTGKKQKTQFADKIKQGLNKRLENKYGVDSYENLDDDSKKTIKKDYTTEVATCALASMALSVVCYSKSRNALKGSVQALTNSAKKMMGTLSPMDEAEGFGTWLSDRISAFLNRGALKQRAQEINSSVRTIIDREKNASITSSKAANKIIDNIAGADKLLFRCQTGRTVSADEVSSIVTSLQEIGQNDLASNLYKHSQNGLSGESGAKVLSDVVDAIRPQANGAKAYNTTVAGITSLADEIEAAGNKNLAGAMRSFVREGAKDADSITIPFDKFNQTIQDNVATSLNKTVPVQFDTNSGLHSLIKTILKDDNQVAMFEAKLGQNGIANGADAIEAGASLALGAFGGKETLEAVDAFTDLNDEKIGDAASAKSNIIDAKHNHSKISSDDAIKLAKAAANVVLSGQI